MNIVKSIEQLRDEIRPAKRHGTVVSLVPTMGYLHKGHLSLVSLAKQKSDHVIVSLFVNPAQFNDATDFELYPRDFERDRQVLHDAGVNTVFAPDVDVIYGDHFQTSIRLSSLAASFEGRSRPGHFEGMATVVSILFNLVEPDLAIFGEKDFQQLRIIEQMVDD